MTDKFAVYSTTPGAIFTPGGGGLTPTGIKTADYTAAVGELVRVDTTVGPAAILLTAPPTPANGARFGVWSEFALLPYNLRDFNLDGNGKSFAPGSRPGLGPVRASDLLMSWTFSAAADEWVLDSTNEAHIVSLVAKFAGFRTTEDDTPVAIFSFLLPLTHITYQTQFRIAARKVGLGGAGNNAQFRVEAQFVNNAGTVTEEWFNFIVDDVPAALFGIVVDYLIVGTEVFLRVKGLPAEFVRFNVTGDVRVEDPI